MGHGTHVAGSIAGKGIYSNGIIKGTGFGAQLSAIGMWSPMLNNLSVPSKLSTIFTAAIQDGASVESNSWGSPRNLGEYDSFANQVDEFTWKNSELLVLFAAGNSGADADKDGRIDGNSISSPGTSKNALTVGASENVTTSGGIQVPISKLRSGKDNWGVEPIFSSYLSDNRDGIAMFSSRGPTADGRIKPDIVAPGTNILSARSHHKDASALWGAYNDNYVWSGGTSMATPLVAGAALVAREYLQKRLKLERPTAAALKAYLIHNADEMYPGQYGEGGVSRGQEILTLRPNGDEGFGRVNMNKMTRDSQNITVVDQRTGVAVGEDFKIPLHLEKAGRLRATLVWMDAPASPNAQKTLVNDLDLVLVGAGASTLGGKDHVNNVEMIEQSLGAGDVEIHVLGQNIPQGIAGRCPFALVYSVE